jgi:hypothetical protein
MNSYSVIAKCSDCGLFAAFTSFLQSLQSILSFRQKDRVCYRRVCGGVRRLAARKPCARLVVAEGNVVKSGRRRRGEGKR